MVQTQTFRPPSEAERDIMSKLMQAEFPGRDELTEQLASAVVRPLDEDGSLEIKAESGPPARVVKRVPVEAESADTDGVPIYYLLHVVNGRAIELETYKADGTPIVRPPNSDDLRVIVLPA